MKKIILTSIIIIITNISYSFANNFNTKWGVVLEVTPVTINKIITKPFIRKTCSQVSSNNFNRLSNMAVGGLIGSVIGNKISNNHGAGTIGAVFGSLIAADNSQRYNTQDCSEYIYYSNKTIQEFSHYNIKVRTKRRVLNIRSNEPYNVHDVIYFN
tara:strand:- start:100 stop:567 length:468 start_codon:yes stop_codon:yes gene_type:complete